MIDDPKPVQVRWASGKDRAVSRQALYCIVTTKSGVEIAVVIAMPGGRIKLLPPEPGNATTRLLRHHYPDCTISHIVTGKRCIRVIRGDTVTEITDSVSVAETTQKLGTAPKCVMYRLFNEYY